MKIYDAVLRLDSSPFVEGLQRAQSQLTDHYRKYDQVGRTFMQSGRDMERMGRTLSAAVTAPVVGVGVAAVTAGRSFQQEMQTVRAISGATGSDFQQLEDIAKKMGRETKFSATESAEALKYMAMAGWETSEMTAGLEPILNLAVASGEDLASTSDIVTDALTAFGLTASDASRFTDVLAQSASSSNTSVSLLGESFQYIAPLAGTLGYSVEDVALALGTMANAGIKGSKAGRALSTTLMRLGDPTTEMQGAMDALGISMTDAEGNMLPLRDTLDGMRTAFQGMTEEEQLYYANLLFGKDAASAMLPILNASQEEWDNLAGSIDNAEGATARMRDVMEDSLSGDWDKMKSAIEGSLLDIFEILEPTIRDVMTKISKAMEKFQALPDGTKEKIVKIALAFAALGPVLIGLGKINKGIGGTILRFAELGKGIGKAGGVLKWLSGQPIGLVFKGFGKLGGGVVGLLGKFVTFIAGLGPVGWVLLALIPIIILVIKHWDKIKEAVSNFVESAKEKLDAFKAKVSAIGEAVIGSITEKVQAAKEKLNSIVEFMKTGFKKGWEAAWNGLKSVVTTVSEGIKSTFSRAINFVIDKVNDFIGMINSIQIPSWMPIVGGASPNIPTIEHRARGDNNWQGGLVQIHERGGEIVDLPSGTRIMPHDRSVQEAYKMGSSRGAGASKAEYNLTLAKIADQIVVREEADIDLILDKMERRFRFARLNSVRGGI